MRRLAVPTFLALAALLLAAPFASAKPRLPAGADAAPVLPPGVVPADSRPVAHAERQAPSSSPTLSAAGKAFSIREGALPLWATVNICDTERSPNALGVRTSVPGDGSGRRVYARFTAQWWSRTKQEWLTVGGTGTTDWLYVASLDWSAEQAGWTFHFSQPPAGTTYVLRGIVELTWRRREARDRGRVARWSVVRRRALLTETGMTRVQGGDPNGTSKAMCLLW